VAKETHFKGEVNNAPANAAQPHTTKGDKKPLQDRERSESLGKRQPEKKNFRGRKKKAASRRFVLEEEHQGKIRVGSYSRFLPFGE